MVRAQKPEQQKIRSSQYVYKILSKIIYNYETIILRNINNQVSILSESVIMLSLISNKRSFIASFSEHLMQGITDTWLHHTDESAQKYERLGSKI